MIIVIACAFVVGVEAIGPEGKAGATARIRFRRFYLVWLALLDQVLVISVLPGHQHLALDIANLVVLRRSRRILRLVQPAHPRRLAGRRRRGARTSLAIVSPTVGRCRRAHPL